MKKLPIKPLIRFTLVSKTWMSLIHNSKFIADHNVIHQAQPQSHLLVMTADENIVIYSHYHSTVDDDAFPQFKFFVTLPFSINLAIWEQVIVGSSQGLLCFISNKGRGFDCILSIISDMDALCEKVETTWMYCGRKLMEFGTKGNIVRQVEVFTLSSGVWRSPCSNLPRKSNASNKIT
uniref:F-box domain-containing protein n=1 Tax=Tanacetum cinerariifolium TaxID=118510 RepID=A0A699HL24_TANCI|nr:hypothetical protein [Tanacetum cinerariifolium]